MAYVYNHSTYKLIRVHRREERRKAGRFISNQALSGDLHVTNPQLMPNIIKQGHLLPVDSWRKPQDETLDILMRLGNYF